MYLIISKVPFGEDVPQISVPHTLTNGINLLDLLFRKVEDLEIGLDTFGGDGFGDNCTNHRQSAKLVSCSTQHTTTNKCIPTIPLLTSQLKITLAAGFRTFFATSKMVGSSSTPLPVAKGL